MIYFRPFQEMKRKVYESYFFAESDHCCELSYANLCMWGEHLFAIIDKQCMILSKYNETYRYHFPLGAGEKTHALDQLIEDAKERNLPCLITSLTKENIDTLETLFPNQFDILLERNSYDYVYEIDKLADLKGRKYHRKRNHYNNFCKRLPDFYTVPITTENLADVERFAKEWYQNRLAESLENDYENEQKALKKCLTQYEEIGMEGLILCHGHEILAFTIGSRISPDTFDVHFEKARWNVEGAYTVINSEFAKYIRAKYPEIKFLNREEDMGLEGLRKAKESYFPCRMVEKATALLKGDAHA